MHVVDVQYHQMIICLDENPTPETDQHQPALN